MGQKVNPVGMRIGINKNWNTRWYANDKDYATYLLEDIKIREFLTKEFKDARVSHVEIDRTKKDDGLLTVATVYVVSEGAAKGEKGEKITDAVARLQKLVKTGKVRVDIASVQNPNLDAKLVALKIAQDLENRASFRMAQKKAIKDCRAAGALGVKTSVSGRLGGADIARSEGYKEGLLSLHTLRSDIDFATAEAETTYGRLGIKVWICRGFIEEKKKNTKEGE